MSKKIKSLRSLVTLSRSLKKRKKRIVFTNGCFDIMHAGHVRYLRQARACGDVLVVGVNRDQSIRKIKGPGRPIVVEKDRAEVLSALECVDYVVFFGEETPRRVIRALKPDVLVKGSDWARDQIVGTDILDTYGGKVRRIPLLKGRSTSNIIRKIKRSRGL